MVTASTSSVNHYFELLADPNESKYDQAKTFMEEASREEIQEFTSLALDKMTKFHPETARAITRIEITKGMNEWNSTKKIAEWLGQFTHLKSFGLNPGKMSLSKSRISKVYRKLPDSLEHLSIDYYMKYGRAPYIRICRPIRENKPCYPSRDRFPNLISFRYHTNEKWYRVGHTQRRQAALRTFLATHPNLELLSDHRNKLDETTMMQIVEQHPNLKIDLGYPFVTPSCSPQTTLSFLQNRERQNELSLYSDHRYSEEYSNATAQLLNAAQNLRVLRHLPPLKTEEMLDAFETHVNSLEVLHINVSQDSFEGTLNLIAQCKNLRILNIVFDEDIPKAMFTKTIMMNLSKNLSELNVLFVRLNSRESDAGQSDVVLNPFIRHCKKLEAITVDGMINFSKRSVDSMKKHLQNLRILQILNPNLSIHRSKQILDGISSLLFQHDCATIGIYQSLFWHGKGSV